MEANSVDATNNVCKNEIKKMLTSEENKSSILMEM